MTNYFTHDKKSWWSMLILIAVATLGVPCVTFAAERPAGNSSGYNISSPRPQGTHSRGFHRSRFFGADGFNEVEVTVEQSQSAPTMEAEKPDQKRTYVQPHWVDGGYGVEILEPGHWIDTEPGR